MGLPGSSNDHRNGIPAATEAVDRDVFPVVPNIEELPPAGTFSQPSTGRPLALAILNDPYPGNIHIPNLPEYNGTTDPEDHLSSFEILMPLIGASDATMCKILPATLGGDARQWYSQLHNGIINNFTEFSTLFRCKFYAQKRQAVSINQLMNTKQREGEALKAYYARYNTLAIGVTSLSVEVIVNTLTRGTTNSLLRASLIKKPPRSMFELQVRVMKYIGLEEALQDSSYVVPKRRRDSPPSNRETLQRPRPTLDNMAKTQKDDRRRDGPFHSGQNFTPLNNPRRTVLQVIQDKKLPVTWAPRGRIKPRKGKNQFCDFHRGYGHDTEQCEKLGRSIEGLIQNGQLKQFIQSSKGPDSL
ncbi:unnamed protein product [Linum trigynum]|uniref:Retrotransposon gag domain-containing protein n=1 Tax=Linum trigynum TaxID=586398 RepID=A0AAV2G841_9ROSI